MTDKQRIDQIVVIIRRIADTHGLDVSFQASETITHALAESPEYLQAIMPDGVEAVASVVLADVLGDENDLIWKSRFHAIDDSLASTELYPASAILAATAPLKAEIERLTREKGIEHDTANAHMWETDNLRQQLINEQSNVKVLTDALEKIAANKHQSISLASMPPIDQRAYWAEQALANVMGK